MKMKKSSLVAMIMGVIGVLCLGIGMCMVLITEWNLFQLGIIVGVVGIVELLLTVFVWRRMEKKAPIHPTVKVVETVVLSIVGCITFGIGMSLCMVFDHMAAGIVVGVVGILLLLLLIPLIKSEN